MKQFNSAMILLLAVIIPSATFLIELITGICASALFDPMASVAMIPAVASVPVIAALGWWKRVRGLEWLTDRWLSFLCMWNVVIAGYFGLVWGPFLGIGVLATVYFGLGLLVLAPLFSFIFGLVGGVRASRRSTSPHRSWFPVSGLAAGILFLAFAEGPSWITMQEIDHLSERNSRENLLSAAKTVERFGSAETCLRIATHTGTPPIAMLRGWARGRQGIQRGESEAAAKLFYRITGASAYDASPHMRHTVDTFSRWDPAVGGDQVAKVIPDLRLKSSYLSGKIETDSGLAYQEWTLEIRNETTLQQEGRFNVLLPRGSVVSRLTLWVNGEPREAAFASKGKVTAAYKSIVQKQRDPVLVRWVAPDRIYVQCFPVPQNGGEMKFRIGYLCPADAAMTAPLIADSNFEILKNLDHTVRLHSDGGMEQPREGLEIVDHPEKGMVLMGQLAHPEFCSPEKMGHLISQNDPPKTVWTNDPMATEDEQSFLVRESLESSEIQASAAVPTVVLLDTSISLQPFREQLSGVVEELGNPDTSWVLAGKEGPEKVSSVEMKSTIDDIRFSGGIDNAEAFLEAVRSVPKTEAAKLIWLHGDQPVETEEGSTDRIKKELEARPNLEIHCLSAYVGSNFLLRELSEFPHLRTATRAIDLVEQTRQLIAGSEANLHEWKRYQTEAEIPAGAAPVSDILARSWAFETSLARHRSGDWTEADTALAARYQLVTPFSGAVVLETAQQYKDNDLKPVDPDLTPSVPSVPEPEFYLLLLVAMLVLCGMKFYRRPRCA